MNGAREALVEEIADWISAYRTADRLPAQMKQACLVEFPGSTGSDFAVGLVMANRREGGR
jgi:hypothetical protein